MKDKGLINRFLDNRTTERIIVVFVFFVYGITVLWFTVFGRPIGRYSPYAELLWSFGKLLSGSWIIGKQILLNIAMFIPFGFLVPICIDKIGQNIILLAFLSIFFSGLIELLQTMLMRGSFEYDDIINNLFGAVTGWILFKIVRKMVFQKYRISIIALISTILMVACFKICIVQIEHVNGQRRHINRSCKDIMYGQKLS